MKMQVQFSLLVRQHDYQILSREAKHLIIKAEPHEEKQFGRITIELKNDFDMHTFFSAAKAIGRDQIVGDVERLSDTVEFKVLSDMASQSLTSNT